MDELNKIIIEFLEFLQDNPNTTLRDIGCNTDIIETPHGVIEITKPRKYGKFRDWEGIHN